MGWILDALRTQGYAMIRLSREERQLVDGLFARSRDFFGCPGAYKETFKTYPLPGGYLTPFPGTYELFELRRGLARCPQELAGEAMGAFQLLERLALRVVTEIGRDIGVDLAAMPSDSSPAMRCIHYDRPRENRGPSDSGVLSRPPPPGSQVRAVGLRGPEAALNGMKGRVRTSDEAGAVVAFEDLPAAVAAACGGAENRHLAFENLRAVRSNAPGVYPAHTDSSLVTVAPRSSAAGLAAKDLNTGEWFLVEEQMHEDDCLVFVGDPADYASLHRYRALMHRAAVADAPGSGRGGSGHRSSRPQHRISAPFFLYPRDSAVLTPRGLPSMVFDDLNGNVNKCRDRFPWKTQSCYYTDLVYSESENGPGEHAK